MRFKQDTSQHYWFSGRHENLSRHLGTNQRYLFDLSLCSLSPPFLTMDQSSTQICLGTYRVARDDLAFRDLLFEFVSPPPTLAPPSKSHLLGGPSSAPPTSSSDLMQMGFPTLVHSTYPAICSCHGKLRVSGYSCPRCRTRICDVPTECRVCGLTVVNAPQLARSYRHLFPVRFRSFSQLPILFYRFQERKLTVLIGYLCIGLKL